MTIEYRPYIGPFPLPFGGPMRRTTDITFANQRLENARIVPPFSNQHGTDMVRILEQSPGQPIHERHLVGTSEINEQNIRVVLSNRLSRLGFSIHIFSSSK
jgi:hypothetical protein